MAKRSREKKEIKVFLDDSRPAPEGWVRTYWPDETIDLLKTGQLTHLSLDNDLGDDERGQGKDVVAWIEEEVITKGFFPPDIVVHSANPVARDAMIQGIESIERWHRRNK